jgi:stage II sporulation protein D
MKTMAALAVLAAVCLAVVPVFFSRKPQKDMPSQMEQEQQMHPLNPQTPEESTASRPDEAAEWEPFLIQDRSTGEIKQVEVRDYVLGALCAEMPPVFDSEALKAQAVSAHTWALYCQNSARSAGKEFDFSADPSHWQGYVTEEQVRERFGDSFEQNWSKLSQAAESVWQEIVVDDEQQPIVAAYHAISSGRTESAENVWGNPLSYLTPVDSKGDIHAQGYEKTVSFSWEELRAKLSLAQPAPKLGEAAEDWIAVLERSPSGYVTLAQVGDRQMSGIELRELLGLRSSDFELSVQEDGVSITTYGYGHGVGLSQYGADYLARQGMSYREILEHYYPGAAVVQREGS